ncbi:endolytic transglycosylase MltG [Streptomyces sp. NPDC087440]|uniref:endolytic transglycosylase MltG n=1 Tax=Streptomyces sp. NPDC087440 TaxID=3365790 RepID=UPI00382083A4
MYGDQGDQGWAGQQAAQGQVPYDPTYAGQQQYPQQGQPQQPYYDNGGPYQQAPQHDGPYVQGHDSGQYPQAQQHTGQYGQGYDSGQYPQGSYDGGQYAQAQQGGQYPQQQGHGQQQGDWDTGQGQAIPYGMNAADPYSGQQPGYGAENHDHYGTPDAYPPPQPPAQRRAAPEPETDWDADAPVQEEHPFFTGADDNRAGRGGGDDDGHDDEPASRRGKGGGKGKKKGRNGVACLVVSLVILGGLGGVGYVAYSFWKDRFGPAEDFAGEGSGQVEVEIKDDAGLNEIGNALKKAGVVKSVDAFTSAAEKNPKGRTLQPGAYTLRQGMSADSAVTLMLDPKSRSNLMVRPGQRNIAVYKDIDKRLGLAEGTTKKIAKEKVGELGLPAWVPKDPKIKDRLEGFLYPATYSAPKGTKPETILKKMVSQATSHYEAQNITEEAAKMKLKPFDLLIVASLVEAEGKTHDDYRKIAEVVYNRRTYNPQTVGRLQFDSTYNYAKGQSNINIGENAINKDKDPYNTYTNDGLPPGPINNPSNDAFTAAVTPTHDGWLYFVATDGLNKTEFAKTHDEFLKLKDKFNDSQKGR